MGRSATGKEELRSKVRLLLPLIKHHNTKVYGGDEVWLHVCLMWAPECSGSHREPFNAREISVGARCTGPRVDLGTGVDAVEKRQTSCHTCRQ